MKRSAGQHYPYITAGQGKGIIENIPPFELAEIIEETDQTGKLPQIYDDFFYEEREWDYRRFDLECCNALFKAEIEQIQFAYEEC